MSNKYISLNDDYINNVVPKNMSVDNEEEEKCCIICLEEIDFNNYTICKTCHNLYHNRCIKQWFKKSNNKNCTYCQQATTKKKKNYIGILKKCLISFF